MHSSATPFYTRHGHTVYPAAHAVIKPRRGIFALAIANGLALFVEQKNTNGILELPGGGIEEDETPDQAIMREWAEETGLPFNLQTPLGEYRHTRGFYAEDIDEFWIYDQTFRLYDYPATVLEGESWINPEQDKAGWKAVSDLAKLRVHQAHGLAIAALISGHD